MFCVTGEEVQEIPLRHEGHEFTKGRQMTKVGYFKLGVSNDQPQRLDLLMGQAEEFLKQVDFFEHFKSGRVNGVAAKVAEEVLVLFEHCYRDATPGQKVTEHHAGRSA